MPISSSIFTRSFAVLLGLIYTYRTKARSSMRQKLSPYLTSLMIEWSIYTFVLYCIIYTNEQCTTSSDLWKYFLKDKPNFLWSTIFVFCGLVWFGWIFPQCENTFNRYTLKWWLKWCRLACQIVLAMIWRKGNTSLL